MLRRALLSAVFLGVVATVVPVPAMAQDIPYLTGGIGLDEREKMAAAEKDYNLKLEMATTKGFYVANAHVIIWNKAGDMMLEATPDGPLMLVDLPAGTYTVNIIYQDKEQKKTVTLNGRTHKKLVFVWDSGDER